jgi:hypothetical protein
MLRSGVLAEFDSPDALVRAVDHLLAHGYTRLDTFTPFAIKDIEEKITAKSPVPAIMLAAGLFGAIFGYVVQWWCNAIDFPINVGGRPLNSAPAFIPIAFESAVLFSSVTGFIAMLALSKLPALWSPVFEVPGFERASIDTFWVGIDRTDPQFDSSITDELTTLGAMRVAQIPPPDSGGVPTEVR